MTCIEIRICVIFRRLQNNGPFIISSVAFPFSRLSPVTPHNSSIHSCCLSLAWAHSQKNTEAARKGLFLIRWNYIDMVVACCNDSAVLRAIDREMLE